LGTFMLIITSDYVTQTVAPVVEPVSLIEAKEHLRVDNFDQDVLIQGFIQAAREYCELYTGRSFVRRTYRADISSFSDAMQLPGKPIVSISSIKYYNTDSPTVLSTLAASNYELARDTVVRSYSGTWPSVYPYSNAVQITYVAGYAPTSSPEIETENVPAAVRAAIRLIVGDLHENRESQILYPGQLLVNPTVNRLLDSYRVYR